MNAAKHFAIAYRQSGWIPLVTTLVLILLPSFFLPFLFAMKDLSIPAPRVFEALTIFLVILLPWTMAVLSIVTMFLAGLWQLVHSFRFKGFVNLFFAIVFILIFIFPVIIFFIRPPGMWAVS